MGSKGREENGGNEMSMECFKRNNSAKWEREKWENIENKFEK